MTGVKVSTPTGEVIIVAVRNAAQEDKDQAGPRLKEAAELGEKLYVVQFEGGQQIICTGMLTLKDIIRKSHEVKGDVL